MTIQDENNMQEAKKTVIVSCSGASNTGTTADRVARKLCVDDPDHNDLLCLAAFAIKKAPSIKKLQEADKIVIIEGCPSRCASEILKQGGFSSTLVVEMVADYGTKKTMTPICDETDVERISKDVTVKFREL
jgi:uncharacterized metal-binding protein